MLAPDPAIALLDTLQPRSLTWLAGVLVGYAVIMWTNPVQESFRDGWRALRRYPALWIIPGGFGFCAALFQLAQRAYFAVVLPPEDRPVFMWVRAAWRDKDLWLTGSEESLWWLPHGDFLAALGQSWMPAFESLAATFNCLVTTFPVSALAAILLLLNRGGHHAVLLRALHRRLGVFGWAVHFGIIICALAAIVKPLLYVAPQILPATALGIWFQWSPVVVWLSFLFEYLFGVFVQTYLILLAYIWVRGLTFTPAHLVDFSIRRFSSVVKWAGVILVLSSIFIDAPLILKNFAPFAGWFPVGDAFTTRLAVARGALAAVALLGATMQITLIFHSESLPAALRDHLAFLRQHWWPLAWFLIIAALHCFVMHAGNLSIAHGIGEGTALWVAWSLVFPWLAAVIAAWLLASWVCVYKRCTTPAQAPARQTVFKF
jgi:hypothetical protein